MAWPCSRSRACNAAYGADRGAARHRLRPGAGPHHRHPGRQRGRQDHTLRAICGRCARGEIGCSRRRTTGRHRRHRAPAWPTCPTGAARSSQLTVEENLRLGALYPARPGSHRRRLERMYCYFPRLGERRHQQAGTLSGGEQQMLAISRALMLGPQAAAAGRAVVRPGAADRAGDLPHPAPHQQPTTASPSAGRTERQPGARTRRPGLPAGDRPCCDVGHRERLTPTSRCGARTRVLSCGHTMDGFLHQILSGLANGGIYASSRWRW